MSGFLSAVQGQASTLLPGLSNLGNTAPSWLTQLRPASFRGAPFYVDTTERQGGRRLVTHEFVLRDEPASEDLGRATKRYRFRAYLIGDGYMTALQALLQALEEKNTPGTLVHPYHGQITVRAGINRVVESKETGGYAAIDLDFVRDGQQPAPTGTNSTASTLIAGIASALPVLQQAYGLATAVATNPSILLGLTTNLLGSAAASWLGLPASTIAGLTGTIESLAASAATPSTTASIVGTFALAAADNVVTALAPPDITDNPVTGTVPPIATSSDPSGGLAALASWGATLAPVPALMSYYTNGAYTGPTDPSQAPAGVSSVAVQQAVTQQAVVDLVSGAATLATAQIYANTDWVSSNAAAAARTQLQTLFDARITAAANAGQAALYLAMRAVETQALTDLIQRAQALPSLANYGPMASMPALALANLFYQDPTRADQLVALNDAPHPLFMPPTGVRLSS